jgi:hypothetical protein
MLALTEIEEGHDSGFLVLRWVAFEDFFYEPFILRREFERDRQVIVVSISMLSKAISRCRNDRQLLVGTNHGECFAANRESR